jgi:succinate-semialdehyde dehydrogenase/glutarate-semialdehyde dehydrogenase
MHSRCGALWKNNQSLIGGKWVSGCLETAIAVIDPALGQVLGHTPRVSKTLVDDAIQAAADAQKKWACELGMTRARLLRRIAQLHHEHLDTLAYILTREQGKPLSEAIGEIKYSASYFEWFADQARIIHGDVLPSNQVNNRLFVTKEPVGVTAAITPVRSDLRFMFFLFRV